MAFDFPNSPTNGQTVTGPNNAMWRWDGVKWQATGASLPEAPTDGQTYGRDGQTASWNAVLPLSGGTVTGSTTFSGSFPSITATQGSVLGSVYANPGGNLTLSPYDTSHNITFGDPNLGQGIIAQMSFSGGLLVPGNLTAGFYRTQNSTYVGSGGAGQRIADLEANYSGTFSSIPNIGYFGISSDTITSGATPIALNIAQNYGGGSAAGARVASQFQLTQTGAVTGPQSAQNVVGNFWFQSNYNAGGTGPGTASSGYAYGLNPQVLLLPGATYFSLVNALGEVDIGVQGTAQACTVGGTATAGDTLSLTFANAAITGSPVTVSYTVGTVESVPAMGNGLVAAIWNNAALRAAGVSATISNNSGALTLWWPLEIGTVTVTRSVSGAATETITLGAVTPGASANAKYGMTIVRLGDDTGPPMADSAAIAVADQLTTPAAGWRALLSIGGGSAQWPLAPRGTLIKAGVQTAAAGFGQTQPLPANLATTGIDFSKINFSQQSGNALLMPGYTLDGTGAAHYGSGTVGRGSSGLSIDSVGWSGSGNASVVAGGGGSGGPANRYYIGDLVYDDLGGQHSITGVNPATGAVTSLTTLVQPSGPAGSAPAGTRNTTGGSGIGLTVGIIWAAATTLTLNPSGGQINPAGVMGPMSFGQRLAASNGDMSQHITLFNDGTHAYGIGVASLTLCFISNFQWGFINQSGATMAYISNVGHVIANGGLGAWNTTPPSAKPTVTGAKGGNAALGSLLAALVSYGLVTDSTTA